MIVKVVVLAAWCRYVRPSGSGQGWFIVMESVVVIMYWLDLVLVVIRKVATIGACVSARCARY